MAQGEEAMITQKQVLEAVKDFKPYFSETTLRRYMNSLLEILSDEELKILAFNNDVPHAIRRKAYVILKQRNHDIIDNSIQHDDAVEC
jgi:hypothetical protein